MMSKLQRRVGVGLARPQSQQRAGERCRGGGNAARDGAIDHGAIADRLGTERVLADRHQHAAERRVHDAQQDQDQHQRHGIDEIVVEQPAVETHAEQRVAEGEGRAQGRRQPVVQPVLAARQIGELRGQDREGAGDGQGDHGEEDGAHSRG